MLTESTLIRFSQQLDHLGLRIEQLKQEKITATQQLEEARKKAAELTQQLRDEQAKTRQIEKKLAESEKNALKSKDFGKIVNINLSETDTNAEMKQQLNRYIHDLDRCIAYLSRLS